jgi:putative nucleotidyltransferase with HDIG domain
MRGFSLDRLTTSQIELLRRVAGAADRARVCVLVGGAVRDALAVRRLPRVGAADLDVTVDRDAVAIARRLADAAGGAFVPLDAERGAARVLVGGHRIDLTDLRAPTLDADLAARDFTVNALAVPVRELLERGRAPIVDPSGGLADLARRRLRPPGPGVLLDDPLRALRGVRLEAELGFRLTPAAARAVAAAAAALSRVSAERVRDELTALLGLTAAADALRRADRLGLLRAIVPEVDAMRATSQPAPHRFDVLEHSLRTVEACDAIAARPGMLEPLGEELAGHLDQSIAGGVKRRHVLKLAALLHDVAKPETRRVVDGRVRFFEHDTRGAERARTIGARLRLPGAVIAVLERLVRHHLRPMHLGAAGAVTDRARYRFYRDLGPDARDLLLLVLADAAAVRGESLHRSWRRATLVRDLLRGWQQQRDSAAAPPLLRGGDVMARLGLAPGPLVGDLLARVREAQELGVVRTREEALAYLDALAPGRAAEDDRDSAREPE